MKDEIFWVEKARNGDQRAFRKLYDGHVEPLYRFMRRHSKDAGQVEDWVQRAFIKAYRNIGSFNGVARFSTWLYTIALNEMRTDFRRPNLVILEPGPFAEERSTGAQDDSFIWEDMMKQWLAELDDSKRMVFVLYEVEGYSHAEIASMLNINEGASRTLLHRARNLLKSRWETEEKSA